MDIEAKLDLILNEIKDHYGHLPIDKNWERICRLVTDGNGVDTGNPDFHNDPILQSYLGRLNDENYIRKFQNANGDPPYWVATVKGLKFIGFVNERNQNTTKNRTLRLTNFSLIFGGLAAGLYYSYELLKILYSFFYDCQ